MKLGLLLCLVIGAGFTLIGCANQPNTASNSTRKGFYDPGSVAPVSGGPATPRALRPRFEP